MKVLFIGSEPQTAEKVNLAARLRWPDASVIVAGENERGLEVLEDQTPDVVLFQSSGSLRPVDRFIKDMRAFSDVPLIVIETEGGGQEMEEIKALEAGADDYVRSSAGVIDLVARLVALIRRVRRVESGVAHGPLSSGDLTLDPTSYEVFLDSKRLTLTSTEFELLHLFLRNRGTVVSHEFLARSLWGEQVDSSPRPPLSRVPGSGVRGRGSGERETTASSLAGKEESSRKEDNSGQGKDGPAGAIAQGGNGR